MNQTSMDSDAFVRRSHLGLGIALGLVVLLGAGALALPLWPDSAASAYAGNAATLLPIAIAIAVGVLLRPVAGSSRSATGQAMKAVLNDELRQQSQNRAYRNGFIAVLVLQPLLAMLAAYTSAAHPAALMASATAALGVIVVLASILWYDR
jgi:hypothetical protein